jgi:hypothetical protein
MGTRHHSGLERPGKSAYSALMHNRLTSPPSDWLEALAESDADLAAGRIVSGDVVLRELQESLVRLEAKAAIRPSSKETRRR